MRREWQRYADMYTGRKPGPTCSSDDWGRPGAYGAQWMTAAERAREEGLGVVLDPIHTSGSWHA